MESLEKLIALENHVRNFGFEWPDAVTIVDQAISECEEIRNEIISEGNPQRLQEEIGDLLHTGLSLCYFAGFDIEETLHKVHEKFSARIAALEEIYKAEGYSDLKGQPLETLLELWKKAKLQADLKKRA